MTASITGKQVMAIDSANALVLYNASSPDARPLAEQLGKMKGIIADVLGVNPDRVNVKVTSTDRLGAIGRGEGIAAQVVALLGDANG